MTVSSRFRACRHRAAPKLGAERRDQRTRLLRTECGPDTHLESELTERLGRAAVLAMLQVARRCPGAVMDSTWFDYALPLARALPGQLVEVHCTVPRDVAMARYQARAARRHAGHLDAERSDQELWGEPPPSPGLGPVIQVDTSGEVDISRLIEKLDQLRRE